MNDGAMYTDRRKANQPITNIKLFYWFIGTSNMCRKAPVCPKFERRSKDGVDGACKHCEYIKQERKQLRILRVVLAASFVAFLITTYLHFP